MYLIKFISTFICELSFSHFLLFFNSGNNQRLEFLGDTVLQLIVSDYLFKHFPSHHEGHLFLLRSSLVSNETQALVCDELGMRKFLIKEPNVTKDGQLADIKMKDKADLVEGMHS